MASFPLPLCLLFWLLLLWNRPSFVSKQHLLWSQIRNLGRAQRDSSSLFHETTTETCHVGLEVWHPRWPTQVTHLPTHHKSGESVLTFGFSPQMAWGFLIVGWPGSCKEPVSKVTWYHFSSDEGLWYIPHLRGGNSNPGF